MSNLRQAAQQALEALDQLTDAVDGTGFSSKPSFTFALDTITALRAALAEQAECGADQEIEAAAIGWQETCSRCKHLLRSGDDGNVSAWVAPGRYEKDTHNLAWLAWKAGVAAGRERCAVWVDLRRLEFCFQHANHDPHTGAVEFGRGPHAEAKAEYVGELEEIAQGLRALGPNVLTSEDFHACTAPNPAELAGQAEGLFPSFIRRTDQERCQNLVNDIFQTEDRLIDFSLMAQTMTTEALAALNDKGIIEWVGDGLGGRWMKVNKAKASCDDRFEVTLKLDGSSMTVFARGHAGEDTIVVESGVCSRNLQLKVNEANADNTFIRIALQSGLLGVLEQFARDGEGSFAVQGELMGPGIQGNRENLKEHKLFVFDVQNIDKQTYLTPAERREFMEALYRNGVSPDLVKHTPVRHYNVTLAELGITNVKEMLAAAEHESLVHPVAEGDVYKRMDGGFSFKAINNVYLAKEKD